MRSHRILHEPLWPGLIALVAVCALIAVIYLILKPPTHPEVLFLPAVILLGLIVVEESIDPHRHRVLARRVGFVNTAIATGVVLFALTDLLYVLFKGGYQAESLFVAAGCTWFATVLTFAVWYWRLDGGGIHHRRMSEQHEEWALLFPQMTLDDETRTSCGASRWRPRFIDYLFVSFTTSTAFSPTDTLPLTRWVKVLMMLQATVSLAIVVLLVGRLVNVMGATPVDGATSNVSQSQNTLKTAGGPTSLNRSR